MMKITTFGFAINADPTQIDQCLVPALIAEEPSLSNLNWVDNIYSKVGDPSNTIAKSKLSNYLTFYKTHTICIIAASDQGIETCLDMYNTGLSILSSKNPPTSIDHENNLHHPYILIDHKTQKSEHISTLNASQMPLKELNAIYIDLNLVRNNHIEQLHAVIERGQPQLIYLYGLKSADVINGVKIIAKLTQALRPNSSSGL